MKRLFWGCFATSLALSVPGVAIAHDTLPTKETARSLVDGTRALPNLDPIRARTLPAVAELAGVVPPATGAEGGGTQTSNQEPPKPDVDLKVDESPGAANAELCEKECAPATKITLLPQVIL